MMQLQKKLNEKQLALCLKPFSFSCHVVGPSALQGDKNQGGSEVVSKEGVAAHREGGGASVKAVTPKNCTF